MSRAVVVVSVAAALFYALCAPAGAYWGDSAQLSERALTLHLDAGVRSYPLHRVLAWAASGLVGDPATGAAAISWVAGGAAVGVTMALARRVTGDAGAAMVAAAALAFSPVFWGYSEVAEVYSLLALIVAVMLFVAVGPPGRRGDLLLGVLLGVALLHHRVGVLAWGLLVAGRLAGVPHGTRWRAVVRSVGAAAVAALPFAVLAVAGDAPIVGERTASALTAPAGDGLGRALGTTARWAAYAASPLVLLAAFVGAARLPRVTALTLSGVAVLALGVPVWLGARGDIVVLGVAALPSLAVLAAAAVAPSWSRAPRMRRPAAVLLGLAPLLTALMMTATGGAERVFSGYTPEIARGMWLPVLSDHEPEAHARAILAAAPADGAVRADWGVGRLLQFVQAARGVRPDVRVEIGSLTGVEPGQVVAVTPIFRDLRGRIGAPRSSLREIRPGVFAVEARGE